MLDFRMPDTHNSAAERVSPADEVATGLFQAEVARVRATRFAAGLSVSTVDQSGAVVHVHSDGSVRSDRAVKAD